MYPILIQFDKGHESSDAKRPRILEITANVVSATPDALQRILKKEKDKINTWLLFGDAKMNVQFVESGELIATGKYEFNIFAGRGNYEFKMER